MRFLLPFLFLALTSLNSRAWSDMGHRFTALVAYDLLENGVGDSVLTILSNHPYYQQHFFDEMPDFSDENQNIKGPWLFSQMAVWSDVIKRRDINYSPQHRRWHYINHPIFLTEIDERYYKNNVPVNLELEAGEEVSDKWNIAQAYQYNIRLLESDSLAAKAVALCWLFHLIGDIHQPLHSSALFNEQRFVKGDLGGNAINVKGIGVMHVAWDRSTYQIEDIGSTFSENFGALKGMKEMYRKFGEEAAADTTFIQWMKESHELAKEVGYPAELLDAIKESKEEKYGFSNTLSIKLDKDFTSAWKSKIIKTSMIQITKCGYRLAYLLNKQFRKEAP